MGVGVKGLGVEVFGRGFFNEDAAVHNADGVAKIAGNAQIVGDENVAELVRLFEVLQQVDDLALNAYVQSGNNFVTN